jgi:hypothetical protein
MTGLEKIPAGIYETWRMLQRILMDSSRPQGSDEPSGFIRTPGWRGKSSEFL